MDGWITMYSIKRKSLFTTALTAICKVACKQRQICPLAPFWSRRDYQSGCILIDEVKLDV